MDVFVLGCNQVVSSQFSHENVTKIGDKAFYSGSIVLDKTSTFYPKRGDEKIMRTDAIASIISINEMLQDFKGDLNKEETALFVASGVFIEDVEQHLGYLTKVFEKIKDAKDNSEKLKKIYRASPPLLALQTLTNSTMSFISQYSGVKGNNATFGNTSLSGFYSIKEAMSEVEFTNNMALACASNGAGAYSFLMNSSVRNSIDNWKESAAVGMLLLGKEGDGKPLCKISHASMLSPKIDWNGSVIQRNWLKLMPLESADCIIYSGAFTKEEHLEDEKYCAALNKKSISFYNDYGNMGPSNLFISISEGIKLLNSGASKIDILDRDIYGCESHIRIESAE